MPLDMRKDKLTQGLFFVYFLLTAIFHASKPQSSKRTSLGHTMPAQITSESISNVKSLFTAAQAIKGAIAEWGKYCVEPKHYDKRDFRFVQGKTDRFVSAYLPEVTLETSVGKYGSSSCSIFLHVNDKERFAKYYVRAINMHRDAILATMANLMIADANEQVGRAKAEVDAQLAMLASIEQSAMAQVSA